MSNRVAVDGISDEFLVVINQRAKQCGMSRSAYMQHVAMLDCARAGLWPPRAETAAPAVRVLPAGAPEPLLVFAEAMSKAGDDLARAVSETLDGLARAVPEPVQPTNTPSANPNDSCGQL